MTATKPTRTVKIDSRTKREHRRRARQFARALVDRHVANVSKKPGPGEVAVLRRRIRRFDERLTLLNRRLERIGRQGTATR